MSQYFCHSCGISLGHVTPSVSGNISGNAYQLEKFIKHTAPTGSYAMNSVFDDPTYSNYRDYTVSGVYSGCLEIDSYNRKNMVWYAGKQIGLTYSGSFTVPESGVKVVLHHDQTKIYSYPFTPPQALKCQHCGAVIAF